MAGRSILRWVGKEGKACKPCLLGHLAISYIELLENLGKERRASQLRELSLTENEERVAQELDQIHNEICLTDKEACSYLDKLEHAMKNTNIES